MYLNLKQYIHDESLPENVMVLFIKNNQFSVRKTKKNFSRFCFYKDLRDTIVNHTSNSLTWCLIHSDVYRYYKEVLVLKLKLYRRRESDSNENA